MQPFIIYVITVVVCVSVAVLVGWAMVKAAKDAGLGKDDAGSSDGGSSDGPPAS